MQSPGPACGGDNIATPHETTLDNWWCAGIALAPRRSRDELIRCRMHNDYLHGLTLSHSFASSAPYVSVALYPAVFCCSFDLGLGWIVLHGGWASRGHAILGMDHTKSHHANPHHILLAPSLFLPAVHCTLHVEAIALC